MARKKSTTRTVKHPSGRTVHISKKTGLFVKAPKKSSAKSVPYYRSGDGHGGLSRPVACER